MFPVSYFTSGPKRRRSAPKYKFSKEDDIQLIMLVNEFGTLNWSEIASRMEGRNPRQCRERWNNYVNPDLIPRDWTPQEDYLLELKYLELGPKWHVIASFFKNRSVNNIRSRWRGKHRNSSKSFQEKQVSLDQEKSEESEDDGTPRFVTPNNKEEKDFKCPAISAIINTEPLNIKVLQFPSFTNLNIIYFYIIGQID